MNTIDTYLAELSTQVKHDPFFKVLASEVMDKILDIRNSLPEIVSDGDEMKKYFAGKS